MVGLDEINDFMKRGREAQSAVNKILKDQQKSREPVKLVIFMEGGIIQDMLIACDRADVYIVDHDIEGADEEDLVDITFGEGEDKHVETSYLSCWSLGDRETDKDPKFIEQIEKKYAEILEKQKEPDR